ncbi:MAG: TIGR02757 family protein [Deltaproteobacteria bacterium]|nr:MAG: TIGR02757 family protein [Deltaproteobacteria bacterium]
MTLAASLDALLAATDVDARLAADPVRFAHRYEDPRDIEVAALFASQLAFGRVASFARPLDLILAEADEAGGPYAWIRGFDAQQPTVLATLNYRWIWPGDFLAVATGLRRVLEAGPLASHFRGDTAAEALSAGIGRLADELPSPTRGMTAFLASPRSGSACKRWCMFLRWMVRPSDGIDFGLWTHLSPARLVIPLDTHVHRIALLTGLTERKTANWRTSEDVTRALAAIDPQDPVRFDFALAHLGISGACTGAYEPSICPECALTTLCRVGGARRRTRQTAGHTKKPARSR